MKRIKIKIKLVKLLDGTIQCSINDELFETEIKSEPKLLENMKFFIGGPSDNIHIKEDTVKGAIKNLRIEETTIPKQSFPGYQFLFFLR